jgi:hypothetical protein
VGNHERTGLEPICLALTLCDHLHMGSATERRILLGVFHVIEVAEFPTVYPKMAVYAPLSDGWGRTRVEIQLIDSDEEREPIWLAAAEIQFTDPSQVAEIGFEIQNAVFAGEGPQCHRSIYSVWGDVLKYFDGFLIGLTATPSRQTIGFFNQNLVMEYMHEQAVADHVNVPYDVYEIKTRITEQGSTVDSGFYVGKRSRKTRAWNGRKSWLPTSPMPNSTAPLSPKNKSARSSRPSATSCSPKSSQAHRSPQNHHFRQGRLPCRRHCAHRPRGIRPR